MGDSVMASLSNEHMTMLKKVLNERFIVNNLLPKINDKTKKPQDLHTKQESRAFSAFALHKILDITPKQASKSVTDDFKDKGLDAIYYDDKNETLYLVQAKLKSSEEFQQAEAQSFCEGVRLLLAQNFTQFNDLIKNRQSEIETALDTCSYIKFIFPFTGERMSQSAIQSIENLINDERENEERLCCDFIYYQADDIVKDLLAEQQFNPVHETLILQKLQKIEEPKTTYFGVISIEDLVKLHATHGKALYERNIRYFLGSNKSEVNNAIKTTLQQQPTDFFYLNNGITAICDKIEPKGSPKAKKLKVRNLSIINGAQTVATCAEFVAENASHDISQAKVMFTLIQATAEQAFSKQITKSRNHQNPVQIANFASLDDTQERLRQESAILNYGYYYRPEARNTSGVNSFDLNEAIHALALEMVDTRFVTFLKREFTKLTNPDSKFYQAIFNDELTAHHLINAVLCYREIMGLLLQAENSSPPNSRERMIYRHGKYAIASVLMKRLSKKIHAAQLMKADEIKVLISQPFDILRQQASDLGHRDILDKGALAYFKNQNDVVHYVSELMTINYQLTDNIAVNRLNNIAGQVEDFPKERLLKFLSQSAQKI